MTSDEEYVDDERDKIFVDAMRRLQKLKGFAPMTQAEAEAAYEAAEPAEPMTDEQIREMVRKITGKDPQC